MVKFYYNLKVLINSKYKICSGKAIIKHVESDYNLSLLGAACLTIFNKMSMNLNRKVCYEALTNRSS